MSRNTLPFLFITVFLSCHISAFAQTGTRIKESSGNYPETVIWINEPQEIDKIRQLMDEGNHRLAVQLARDYVDEIEGVAGLEAQVRQYYGLNALCAALIGSGELAEAIETCDNAIAMYPERWQALNNRGTAHFMAGQYDLAMQDYRRAFEVKPGSENVSTIIQHNIDLTESRTTGAK